MSVGNGERELRASTTALAPFRWPNNISVSIKFLRRLKTQIIIRIPLVKSLWARYRRIGLLYSLKNRIFQQLNKLQSTADQISWNGTTLIGIARKPRG